MTTLELVAYYQGLLILQYNNKPKALATIAMQCAPLILPQTSVQTLSFASAPSSGAFVLAYGASTTSSIAWNDSASTIQTKLRALPGLSEVVVSGAISDLKLTITFHGVYPPALLLTVNSSTLDTGAPSVLEVDETLPLAIQNGFNLLGSDLAQGVQLDTLGKYAGVSRFGFGFGRNIALDDKDFLSLLRMAIAVNYAGSSLSDIQAIIHTFFANQMFVFDYKNMRMSYLIAASIGSQDLVQLFITENLLPKPMGVQIPLIIYAPTVDKFFGFRTYTLPAYNASPFNSYADYTLDTPWLSYANAIVA